MMVTIVTRLDVYALVGGFRVETTNRSILLCGNLGCTGFSMAVRQLSGRALQYENAWPLLAINRTDHGRDPDRLQ
jgi:hypothetical protein